MSLSPLRIQQRHKSKQDTALAEWAAQEATGQHISLEKFCTDHLLPEPAVLAFSRFRDFIEHRRSVLGDRLRGLLQYTTPP
jgi:hypothetical protein